MPPSKGKRRKDPLWARLVISFGAVVLIVSLATVVVPKVLAEWALGDIDVINDIPADIGAADDDYRCRPP